MSSNIAKFAAKILYVKKYIIFISIPGKKKNMFLKTVQKGFDYRTALVKFLQ